MGSSEPSADARSSAREYPRRTLHGSHDRPLQLALVVLFLASRVVFHLMGVRFDLRPLDTSWHILDPVLLREDLLRSVLYTPAQPPLYNLLLGAVYKLSDDATLLAGIFRALYAAASLSCCLFLFQLLRRLGTPGWLGFFATALFMLSPALVLYENIPYYTVLEVLLLTLGCLRCHIALERGTTRSFFWLFMTLAALIYTRAMFQVHWLVVLIAFCVVARPGQARPILRAAAVPLLLVFALYGKNLIVSGQFATSSWLGMSLVKHSVHHLPMSAREQLVERGALSPLALHEETYVVPEELPDFFASQAPTGVPALDEPRKSTGHVNYHHLSYVDVSRTALHDALHVIEREPLLYLRSLGESFLMFMRPAGDYPYLRPNRDALEPWGRFYARLIAGQPRYPEDPWFEREAGTVGYLAMAAYLLSVIAGLAWLLRRKLRGGSASDGTLAFVWLNVMYVSVIGNALEIGENQRFRFIINPLLIASLTTLVTRIAICLRDRATQRAQDRYSTAPAE